VSQVVSPGEYAVRGSLIDLFPMGSAVPYRVDLFDDEIDSIRTFDPDTQRSLYPVPEARLLPGREFPMDDDARTLFRSRWRELLDGDPTKSRIYKDMGTGVATAGIEYYLPLFFEDTATVFDYLGADATLVLHGDLEAPSPFLAGHAGPLPPGAGRPRAPDAAAARAVPERRAVLPAGQGLRAAGAAPRLCDAAEADRGPPEPVGRLPPLTVVRGAEDPLARLKQHLQSTEHPHRCWCWPRAKAAARACWTSCAPARWTRPASTRCRSSSAAARRSAWPPRP
jgi:transcription-repair coupling factor (superfamily II helicase)